MKYTLIVCLGWLLWQGLLVPVRAETLVDTNYWLKVHEVSRQAPEPIKAAFVLNGQRHAQVPDLIIRGSLSVERKSNLQYSCYARLPAEYLYASSPRGQKIRLFLRANIGSDKLGTNPVLVTLDEQGSVDFLLEGFIDPESFQAGLEPGSYNYLDSFNILLDCYI